MPEQNLNPDALAVAALELDMPCASCAIGNDPNPCKFCESTAERVIREYLDALPAQPDTVNSVPGVYDIGSTEPEGIDQVVECDELGHPYVREWDDDADYTWSKTTDGTRWKGYKNGKEYLEWPELVRRYGPVKPVEG